MAQALRKLPTTAQVRSALPTYVNKKVSNADVPVKYKQACKALAECRTIDDAKMWATKADALAAWAKIYAHDEAAKEARLLKIEAFERMGKLAIAMQPGGRRKNATGSLPGPQALLRQCGLTKSQASSAATLARAPKKAKRDFVNKTNIGANGACNYLPFRGTGIVRASASSSWDWLHNTSGTGGAKLCLVKNAFKKRDPYEVAKGLKSDEVAKARELAIELIEWLDAFEHALPKAKKK